MLELYARATKTGAKNDVIVGCNQPSEHITADCMTNKVTAKTKQVYRLLKHIYHNIVFDCRLFIQNMRWQKNYQ